MVWENYEVVILLEDEAKNAGIALAMASIFNEVFRQKHPSEILKSFRLGYIIRLASNRNVWKKLTRKEQQQRRANNADNRGADAIYGKKYKLSEVEDWGLATNSKEQFGTQLANGGKVIVEVLIWEDMLLRSKRKKNMKDKPFRLVSIQLFDAQSGKALFKRRLWLGVWGKRRGELTSEEIYWAFRNRFDIEHFFRFGKQRLLLGSSQTPEEEHLQNWLEIVGLAYWLLWVAKDEASHQTRKWQQYDANLKKRSKLNLSPSPSQVQQQLEGIILSFDQTPFFPKLKIKGKGRKKGLKLPKRPEFPVLKRPKKRRKRRKNDDLYFHNLNRLILVEVQTSVKRLLSKVKTFQ